MEPNKIPEEKNWGLYAGLLLGGLILAIASLSLLQDILNIFSKSIEISAILIFRILLMVLSAYASISCFSGLLKMFKLEKSMSLKVREGYEDFLLYARPLVEEVIRQRIVGEQLIEKMEELNATEKRQVLHSKGSPSLPRWAKFQFLATLLGTATVGLFVFLEAHPWELVPYSVLILSFLWYLVVGGYYGVLLESRSYYIPSLFIAVLPTTSMLLRLQLQLYQVLYVVFIILGLYILLMVIYFEYLVTGRLPYGLGELWTQAIKEAGKKKLSKEELVLEDTILPMEIQTGSTPETGPEISGSGENYGVSTPAVDITSLLKEIENKKQLKMQLVLSEISNDIKLPDYEQKTSTGNQSRIAKKFRDVKLELSKIIWPRRVCDNWKKICVSGIIMMFLSIIALFMLYTDQQDFFLEIFFLGIVMTVAGYSLSWKTERKLFTWLNIPFFIGLVMSVWAVISLFQFFSIYRFEEELKDLALAYVAGILLIVSDTLIIKIRKIRNTAG